MADITIKLTEDEKRALKVQIAGFQQRIREILQNPLWLDKHEDLRKLEKDNNSILRKLM